MRMHTCAIDGGVRFQRTAPQGGRAAGGLQVVSCTAFHVDSTKAPNGIKAPPDGGGAARTRTRSSARLEHSGGPQVVNLTAGGRCARLAPVHTARLLSSSSLLQPTCAWDMARTVRTLLVAPAAPRTQNDRHPETECCCPSPACYYQRTSATVIVPFLRQLTRRGAAGVQRHNAAARGLDGTRAVCQLVLRDRGAPYHRQRFSYHPAQPVADRRGGVAQPWLRRDTGQYHRLNHFGRLHRG